MGWIGCWCGKTQHMSDQGAVLGSYSAGLAILICRECGALRADLPNRRDAPVLGPGAFPDKIVRERIRNASKGRLKEFSRAAGVSVVTLQAMIDGKKEVSTSVAAQVGLRPLGFFDPSSPGITLVDVPKN